MDKEIIHIACNIDTSYVKYCVVMLTSLFENNTDSSFHVHVIAAELPDEMQNLIRSTVSRYSNKASFYFVGNNLGKDYPQYAEGSHISLAAYYRIFLGSILPPNINKVLYLDCDLVVTGSIESLWNVDITDHAVGCIEDMWSGKEDNYERLHYDCSFSYFNSGVLLINLKYWKSKKIEEKAVEYIMSHANELRFYDQDVLNALLHDKKLFLPFRYNVQDGFLRRKRKIRPEAIPELEKELLHPVIIHYTGGKKPWQYKSQHPYKDLYFHYLDMTPWKGERPAVPFSYKMKRMVDRLLYVLQLAKPKYRKK